MHQYIHISIYNNTQSWLLTQPLDHFKNLIIFSTFFFIWGENENINGPHTDDNYRKLYIGNRLAALQAITNILFFGLPKTASLKFLRRNSIDQIDRP